MIRWAVEDQCQIGLDIITDGESYRENMYWFYQLRVDGVDCNEKKYKQFTLGGSTEGVDLTKAHPIVQEKGGFGIECAVVKDKVKNPRWELASEISELENVGCHHVQFDEPVLTEAPSECDWAADIINEIINSFPNLKFSLHICGGNAHRKRGYFGRYTEMLEGLKKLKVHEIHLEHCTLHYNMLDVFNDWKFDGILSFGVIDQRTDEIETIEQIHERILPVLKYFEKNKILISSECGFGHVPLDITRAKLGVLVEAAKKY